MSVLEIRFENEEPHLLDLNESIVTIGRSVDNVLEIPDPNMSRRHCVIERREAGEVILTDCNSSNGTKVNDRAVLSQELADGDVITCGSTVIRYALSRESLEHAARAAHSAQVALTPHGGYPVPPSTLHAAPPLIPPVPPKIGEATDTTLSWNDEATRTGTTPAPVGQRRTAETGKTQVAVLTHERDDLRNVLEITKQLNQVHDLRSLLEAIIDAAIQLMAAERGFLVLTKDGAMKIEIARRSDRTSIPDATLQVSTQICRQVIDTGRPVLTTNAAADDRFGRYKSVAGLRLRSILCVPFRIKEETFGTVLLDAGDVGAFSKRDVEVLSAFGDQAAIAIENARLLNAARRRSRIEQELRIASQIQAKLLPRTFPEVEGLVVYGAAQPAKEVGGDYFDFIVRKDGQLWFCIGDVTGKGVPAGLVMASARSALRSLVGRVEDTRELVVALNRFLCEDLEDEEIFLSFVLMRWEPTTRRLFYTGAGHENILIYRAATKTVEVRKTGGTVLGLTERVESSYKEVELELQPNDTLLLYTDGVTEAMDSNRRQFTLERLEASCERHLSHPPRVALHNIVGDVIRFAGSKQRDDLTLVVVQRNDGELPLGSEPEPETSSTGYPTLGKGDYGDFEER